MRIIHTCLRYPPATGGVERYVQDMVERTRYIPETTTHGDSTTYDVRVLSSNMRTHAPITQLDPNALRDDPPYLQRLTATNTPLLSYPRLQGLKYYLGHHQPDLIHGHSFWYQPADVAANYARKNDIPFIFHPIYYENEIRRKLQWQVYKHTVGRKTFAAADVVAVISPFEQRLIEKAGYPVKRFELIPPGIDTTWLTTPQPNPFPEIAQEGHVLLTVSRLAPGKGLDAAVRAMPKILSAVSDTHLVIAGEDFGSKKELVQLAHDLSLEHNVHFVGRLSDQQLAGAYQHAALLVHPTFYEAFGIVLAESLAAGTPVVARNVAAVPYVAPHEKVSLLFDTDEQLADRVLKLLQDDTERQRFGEAGQTHVKENFSWDASISRLHALYSELLK